MSKIGRKILKKESNIVSVALKCTPQDWDVDNNSQYKKPSLEQERQQQQKYSKTNLVSPLSRLLYLGALLSYFLLFLLFQSAFLLLQPCKVGYIISFVVVRFLKIFVWKHCYFNSPAGLEAMYLPLVLADAYGCSGFASPEFFSHKVILHCRCEP